MDIERIFNYTINIINPFKVNWIVESFARATRIPYSCKYHVHRNQVIFQTTTLYSFHSSFDV